MEGILGAFWLTYACFALVFGFFCMWLAGEKGRGQAKWFLVGLLFGIIALLALVGAPVKSKD